MHGALDPAPVSVCPQDSRGFRVGAGWLNSPSPSQVLMCLVALFRLADLANHVVFGSLPSGAWWRQRRSSLGVACRRDLFLCFTARDLFSLY